MERLLISTTCRKAKIDEPSGHLYVIDLERWEIIQRGSIIEPPYRNIDPNPRGGFRGGKGIAIADKQIIIANTVSIFRFDQNWNLLKVISHPSCSGIHDIFLDPDLVLWVTSARNDLLHKFDLDGNLIDYYYFRQNRKNRSTFTWAQPEILSKEEIIHGQIDFRDPRTHTITTHDSAHVNSVSQLPDGSILVSLGLVVGRKFSTLMKIKDLLSRLGLWSWIVGINQYIQKYFSIEKKRHSDLVLQPATGKSIIARITPSRNIKLCLQVNNVNVPSHSILGRSDGAAIYLNTTTGDIIHFIPEDGRIVSTTNVSNQFLRGIVQISDDNLIVGSQNSLLMFNLKTRKITNRITISNDFNEAVFAIHEFPKFFSLPPISFESLLGKLIGFNQDGPIFK